MGNSNSTAKPKLKPATIDHGEAPRKGQGVIVEVPEGCEPGDNYWDNLQISDSLRALLVGNTLEWYEFSCYAFVAPQIQANFFRGSKVATWASFAATFFARPLGGVVIGWVGDTYGRRPQSLVSATGMCLGTIGQAILPSYIVGGETWGRVGMVLLLCCRLIQGLATGGEVSACTTYISECAPKESMGIFTSYQSVAVYSAFGLSSLAVAILNFFLTPRQMDVFGWRIPFIICILPGGYALWSRYHMEESETFTEECKDILSANDDIGVGDVGSRISGSLDKIKERTWAQALLAIPVVAASAAVWYGAPVFTADLLHQHLGLDPSYALMLTNIAQFLSAALSPIGGYLTDCYGVGTVVFYSYCLNAILPLPMYYLILNNLHNSVLVPAFVGGVAILQMGGPAVVYLFIAELFPAEVRAIGFGFAFNLAVCLFGGLSPMFLELAIRRTLYAPAVYISLTSLLGAASIGYGREQWSKGRLQLTHIRASPY